MQRVTTSVEEQMIVKAIEEEASWETLPKRLKLFLSSKEEWHRKVKEYCIKKRFKWTDCLARNACKENEYYEDLMHYLRKNLALFPYHLADYVCRIQRISPFRYYCDMLYEVMKNERPYDTIPNFSAADALRLTGIGRNEFINIMNKCRTKRLMWKLNKSIIRDMLPTEPVTFPIESWWTINVVNLTLEEFRKLTEEEMVVIDKICKEEVNIFGLLDPEIVRGLYNKGLVYLDVPVSSDDRFKVSNLKGFVSNRDQTYEDPTEELLYAVFVASSEHATVAELAATLQADLSHLEAAVSLACRLGWAKKVIDPATLLQELNFPGSPSSEGSGFEDPFSFSGTSNVSLDGSSDGQFDISSGETTKASPGFSRMAFLVDANLTSYLMMGFVSSGLKAHAVTLYEAGKLGDGSVIELCEDIRQLRDTKFEGELQNLANHAFSLCHALECLRSGGIDGAVDVVLDVPLEDTYETRQVIMDSTIFENGQTDTRLPVFQGSSHERQQQMVSSDDTSMRMDSTVTGGGLKSSWSSINEHHEWNPASDGISDGFGCISSTLHMSDEDFDPRAYVQSTVNVSEHVNNLNSEAAPNPIMLVDGSDRVSSHVKRKKSYNVDILRCESLAGLTPATLRRLLHRDYNVVVSMVPLPLLPGVVSSDGLGPVHLGPPSHAAMTPWMKLMLYSVTGRGPISIALIRGLRLRILPPPLENCEKAWLWSWDGSSVAGVGGKLEGTLVDGCILLHCLNTLLRFSAVLVQPFQKDDLDKGSNGSPLFKDIPLPLDETIQLSKFSDEMQLNDKTISDLHTTLRNVAEELHLWTVGYVRMLRISVPQYGSGGQAFGWVPQSVEFGIPLFNTDLCKLVCDGIIHSNLLLPASLQRQRESMLILQKQLQDFTSQYVQNGPVSRNAYNRGLAKGAPQLTSFFSGRWNPFSDDASTATPATMEFSQAQLDRRRRRSEILSFDGDILRSFPLTPVYEANTRLVDDPGSGLGKTSSIKADPFDDGDINEAALPGVNLIFDGSWLHPFDISPYLQGSIPAALVAEASTASLLLKNNPSLK